MKNSQSSHPTKISSSLLKSLGVACVTLSLLAACGQRGSLYIPTVPEAAKRGTIVDTLTKPVSAPTSTPENNTAPEK